MGPCIAGTDLGGRGRGVSGVAKCSITDVDALIYTAKRLVVVVVKF